MGKGYKKTNENVYFKARKEAAKCNKSYIAEKEQANCWDCPYRHRLITNWVRQRLCQWTK